MVLLGNIRINSKEELIQLKKSITDLSFSFKEYHLKVRGNLKTEALEFLKSLNLKNSNFYQNLSETDWVLATYEMVQHIDDQSLFIYVNDHFLVSSKDHLDDVIKEFDKNKIDYLRYSFFGGYSLNNENILPFNPSRYSQISKIEIDFHSHDLLNKLSPNYFSFALVSMVSKKLFVKLLKNENMKIKLYSNFFSRIMEFFFGIFTIKKFYFYINYFIKKINIIFTFFDPSSPFNLEKITLESKELFSPYRIGILNKELFANFDDDNTVYKSSLIKRGIYPFKELNPSEKLKDYNFKPIIYSKTLISDEEFLLQYSPLKGRIVDIPIIKIEVISGEIEICNKDKQLELGKGGDFIAFSNLYHNVICKEDCKIQLKIFDPSLKN